MMRAATLSVEEKHLGANCETKSSHGRAAVSKEGFCLEVRNSSFLVYCGKLHQNLKNATI
jgi:hypothetical protein